MATSKHRSGTNWFANAFHSLIVLAIVTICGTAFAQTRGGVLNIGLGYEIDTLNPYSTGRLGDAQATILEGLLAPDETAAFVPVLATEVPTLDNGGIVLSDDGTRMTVTYHLRPGVRWHDGEPFTAADVVFTWEAVKDPAFLAESKGGTAYIDAIATPDDLTVVIDYNTVAPDFASTLFTFGILPKHLLEGEDLNTSSYNERPIGTGPFMVNEYRPGQFVQLVRNPYYWGVGDDGQPLPYLDGLVFHILPDSNTLVTQLLSGEIDMAYNVPYSQVAAFETSTADRVIPNTTLSWQHLSMNLESGALGDLTVRRALAHAINRDSISRALGGYPKPIHTVVVPIFPFSNPDVPRYDFDPEGAAAMLDAAGYVLGRDGVRVGPDGQRMSFRFMTQAGRSEYELAQQVMIANAAAIGIELVPDNQSGPALTDRMFASDYDVWYSGWITPGIPNYAIFYATDGVLNSMNYSNPDLDAAIETANGTIDDAVRSAALREFQVILMTDVPTLPIIASPSIIVVPANLRNFVPNPTNMTNFVHTANWYLE
jgi:peptide/nickel transport system substrate-binding protein